jgi:hypothetical protein
VNRYAAAGIAAEAQDGRRILVVSCTYGTARTAFDEISAHTRRADRIVRANGAEGIHHRNGGSVRFTTPRSSSSRGLTVDVIYLDAHVEATPELLATLGPCLAASSYGELIRA